MERLHCYAGALDGALQKTPEVFQTVGVDCAIDVALGMVDDLVRVGVLKSDVGPMRIGADGRTNLDVLGHDCAEMMPPSVHHDGGLTRLCCRSSPEWRSKRPMSATFPAVLLLGMTRAFFALCMNRARPPM